MELPFLGALTMSADYTNSQGPASLESDEVGAEFKVITDNLKAQIEASKK
jgi:hypothetical protein